MEDISARLPWAALAVLCFAETSRHAIPRVATHAAVPAECFEWNRYADSSKNSIISYASTYILDKTGETLQEKWSAIAMLKVFTILLGIFAFGFGTYADAADEEKPAAYVGKVMLEIIVFFPKEFDQLDEKFKNEMKEALKKSGAQECENGLRMPMKPLIGAFLKIGKQPFMTDTNGDFVLPSLPSNTNEIPIYQQLRDQVPLAQFPVKKLFHKGEKVQPFIISMRSPFGECHGGKVDHTN